MFGAGIHHSQRLAASEEAWEEGHSGRCVGSCQGLSIARAGSEEVRGRRQPGGGSGVSRADLGKLLTAKCRLVYRLKKINIGIQDKRLKRKEKGRRGERKKEE